MDDPAFEQLQERGRREAVEGEGESVDRFAYLVSQVVASLTGRGRPEVGGCTRREWNQVADRAFDFLEGGVGPGLESAQLHFFELCASVLLPAAARLGRLCGVFVLQLLMAVLYRQSPHALISEAANRFDPRRGPDGGPGGSGGGAGGFGGASGSLFGPCSAQGGPQKPPPQGPSEQGGPSGSTPPSEGPASQGFKEAPGTLHATACPIIESQLQRFVSHVSAHPFGSTPGRDAVFQERVLDTGTPGWVQLYYATFWETTRQGPNGSILVDRVDMADEILRYFSSVPLPMAAPAHDQQVAPPALTVSSALVVCTPTTDMVGLPDQPLGTAISGPAHDVLPGSMLALGASTIQVQSAAVLQCWET
jgi:hypothetical protein